VLAVVPRRDGGSGVEGRPSFEVGQDGTRTKQVLQRRAKRAVGPLLAARDDHDRLDDVTQRSSDRRRIPQTGGDDAGRARLARQERAGPSIGRGKHYRITRVLRQH
jgi:hypothetical protein